MMPSLKTQIQWFTRGQQILIGAALLALVLFYLAAYGPQSARIRRLNGRIGQSERQLASSESQARALPQVQADINRLLVSLADFKKLPATPGDLGQFQIEIADLVRRNHLRDCSINLPGTPQRNDQYCELPVSLKFDGDFRSNVFAFLCQLEDLPRLTRIKSMTVKGIGIGGDVHVELLMSLYYTEG